MSIQEICMNALLVIMVSGFGIALVGLTFGFVAAVKNH